MSCASPHSDNDFPPCLFFLLAEGDVDRGPSLWSKQDRSKATLKQLTASHSLSPFDLLSYTNGGSGGGGVETSADHTSRIHQQPACPWVVWLRGVGPSESFPIGLVRNPVWIYTAHVWGTRDTVSMVLSFVNEATPSHRQQVRLLMWLTAAAGVPVSPSKTCSWTPEGGTSHTS